MIKKITVVCFLLLNIATAGCQQQDGDQKNKQALLVYAGAGLKKPMEAIKKEFEAAEDVSIDYIYAGSMQLLSQLQTSGKGDVFITGSTIAYSSAKAKGLVNEYRPVAYHTPAIGVPAGNPAKIAHLDDLQNNGVRLIVGDAKANAIGKATREIIKRNDLAAIERNIIAQTSTVNEIVLALSSGQADAGIVTRDAIYNNEHIDIIEIEKERNSNMIIPVCTVKTSRHPDLAEQFVAFVASPRGKELFNRNGFEPVP